MLLMLKGCCIISKSTGAFHICALAYALTVPALPLGELGGCLGRWATGGTKNTVQLCSSESDERTPKKRNEHDESEWNTRSCSLWEDKGTTLQYFRFAAEGLIFGTRKAEVLIAL